MLPLNITNLSRHIAATALKRLSNSYVANRKFLVQRDSQIKSCEGIVYSIFRYQTEMSFLNECSLSSLGESRPKHLLDMLHK